MKYKLHDLKNNNVINALLNSNNWLDKLLGIHIQYKNIDEIKLRKKIQVEYNRSIKKKENVLMFDNITFYIYCSRNKNEKSFVNVLINGRSNESIDLNSYSKNTIMNFIYSFLKNELDE